MAFPSARLSSVVIPDCFTKEGKNEGMVAGLVFLKPVGPSGEDFINQLPHRENQSNLLKAFFEY